MSMKLNASPCRETLLHFSKLMSFFLPFGCFQLPWWGCVSQDASHCLRWQLTRLETTSLKKDSQSEIPLGFQTVVYALVGVFGGWGDFYSIPLFSSMFQATSTVPDTESRLSRCLASELEKEVSN